MGRKSAKIAAKKGAADRAKSQVYTKALHDVATAVKSGGGDPDTNFLLKIALERCKKFNVPKDNIDRAIKRGLGGDGEGYSDITYEGYGAGGVGVFVEASTNNTTRTAANVRSYFNKCNGSLGKDGCLQFIFDRKAVFIVPKGELDEEEFTLEMIDVGAEDIDTTEEGNFEVMGPMESFGDIQTKLQEMNITPEEANLQRIPNNFKSVDEETYTQIEKLIGLLEDDEDVVGVYHNLEGEE
ncbi:MAG: YebC/PmpR family DNA-binding transcriptional regulator [Halobacteriovoraceae bacterium]|nr:YebC/PmpR family DNA-binding transcriptional regulator [Halobacteriovoraceae bacterium]|tara:strand:+ start:616 stop:1335 length:720 start_codon:yes stop_codon:yes gene_type:complete